jgi:hypothetical protein
MLTSSVPTAEVFPPPRHCVRVCSGLREVLEFELHALPSEPIPLLPEDEGDSVLSRIPEDSVPFAMFSALVTDFTFAGLVRQSDEDENSPLVAKVYFRHDAFMLPYIGLGHAKRFLTNLNEMLELYSMHLVTSTCTDDGAIGTIMNPFLVESLHTVDNGKEGFTTIKLADCRRAVGFVGPSKVIIQHSPIVNGWKAMIRELDKHLNKYRESKRDSVASRYDRSCSAAHTKNGGEWHLMPTREYQCFLCERNHVAGRLLLVDDTHQTADEKGLPPEPKDFVCDNCFRDTLISAHTNMLMQRPLHKRLEDVASETELNVNAKRQRTDCTETSSSEEQVPKS